MFTPQQLEQITFHTSVFGGYDMDSVDEFTALAQAATAHVFYHRTYCNHLNAWIKRADLAELDSISYGAELPADLAASMAEIIKAAGGGAE